MNALTAGCTFPDAIGYRNEAIALGSRKLRIVEGWSDALAVVAIRRKRRTNDRRVRSG